MDSAFGKNGDSFKKEMMSSDERLQVNEMVVKKRKIATHMVMSAITVQMAPHSTGSGVEIQTYISADPKSAASTTVVVATHQGNQRVPSRSRSHSPPLPSAMKTWSRYRSRSQTINQRQASGSIPSGCGQITPIGARRTVRVSSLSLTENMKHLTLSESEDIMDFSWE